MREGIPLGAIVIRRMEVRPFTEKQVVLLKSFGRRPTLPSTSSRSRARIRSRIVCRPSKNYPLAGLRADVHEAQKVEGRWLPEVPLLSPLDGEAPNSISRVFSGRLPQPSRGSRYSATPAPVLIDGREGWAHRSRSPVDIAGRPAVTVAHRERAGQPSRRSISTRLSHQEEAR